MRQVVSRRSEMISLCPDWPHRTPFAFEIFGAEDFSVRATLQGEAVAGADSSRLANCFTRALIALVCSPLVRLTHDKTLHAGAFSHPPHRGILVTESHAMQGRCRSEIEPAIGLASTEYQHLHLTYSPPYSLAGP